MRSFQLEYAEQLRKESHASGHLLLFMLEDVRALLVQFTNGQLDDEL